MDSASKVALLSIKSWLLLDPVCEVRVIDKRNISHYFSYWDLLDDPLLSLGIPTKRIFLVLICSIIVADLGLMHLFSLATYLCSERNTGL